MPSDNYIGPFLGGSRAGWAKGISIGASGGDVGQIWIDSGATLHTRFLNRGSGAQQQRIWSTGNTIIVDGGYLKKASPIIKIWSTGEFETNDESAGATVERLSEGVYLIKNVLGFNADAAWGGVDGGIEIPLCKNKLPLIWVDYRVLPDGSIKLMTYHREHHNAPEFARNVRNGYADGDPIDIPSGRFVSVRVQMPATEEDATPQDFPVPVENVASDPR
ncbi:sulfurtransferase [Xenorhabdus kozodoii]|uniref:Sulfurtransferase n=1 Tax=Xenorhabdus kozodoii TaxID=351676 RepID=A0A2D0KRM7_9GAMM|nr:sulfurtransferase [Xenorhabdus kozodoii]